MSIIGNSVNLGGTGSGITFLPYIASTGNEEYINSNYIVTNNTSIEVVANVDATNPIWPAVYGVMETAGVKECVFYTKTNGDNNSFFCWGSSNTTQALPFGSYYGKDTLIRATPAKGEIFNGRNENSKSLSSSSSPASSTYPLYIFAVNDRNAVPSYVYYCKMKLYSFNIYESGIMVRSYKPALDASGRPGLYEIFTKTFYYNIGSGAFTYPTS